MESQIVWIPPTRDLIHILSRMEVMYYKQESSSEELSANGSQPESLIKE